VALTSADRSRPGGAAAFVIRHDCAPTTSPPLTATILTHTIRCPAGESILLPHAAAAAALSLLSEPENNVKLDLLSISLHIIIYPYTFWPPHNTSDRIFAENNLTLLNNK